MRAQRHHAIVQRQNDEVVDYNTYKRIIGALAWPCYFTTYDSALPANPGVALTNVAGVDYVDSWTDQRSGFVLPAIAPSQKPIYAADGAHFRGRRGIQCSATGSRFLQGDVGTIFASGTRPWMLVVCRMRNTQNSPTNRYILAVSNGASVETLPSLVVEWAFFYVNCQTSQFYQFQVPGVTTAPFVAAWGNTLAAGGHATVRPVNTAPRISGATLALAATANRMTVGARYNGTSIADATVLEIIGLAADPGPVIEEQLVSAAARKWGVYDAPNPLNVLGSLLKLEYDPARNVTVSSGRVTQLIDMISSHSVVPAAAGNQPLFTQFDPDFGGAFQGGTASFTSDNAGTDGLRSSAAHGSDIIPAGARPYLATLVKPAAGSGAPTEFFAALHGASSTSDFALYRQSGTTPYTYNFAINGLANGASYTPSNPTAVQLLELIYNGTTLELWRDNVMVLSQPSAPALASAIRRVSLGMRIDDLRWGNQKNAYMIACDAAPTPDQRVQLLPFWRARGAPV